MPSSGAMAFVRFPAFQVRMKALSSDALMSSEAGNVCRTRASHHSADLTVAWAFSPLGNIVGVVGTLFASRAEIAL
jgi:hypothetical protein